MLFLVLVSISWYGKITGIRKCALESLATFAPNWQNICLNVAYWHLDRTCFRHVVAETAGEGLEAFVVEVVVGFVGRHTVSKVSLGFRRDGALTSPPPDYAPSAEGGQAAGVAL